MQEETGIMEEDIILIENANIYVDEMSNRGNANIRYFIAKMNDSSSHHFQFDSSELKSVAWFNVEEILKMGKLKEPRKKVLTEALELYHNLQIN